MSGTFSMKVFMVSILAFMICFVSCRSKTDEDLIRETIKEAGTHIEKKDISGLMDLLSDEYKDFRGRDKTQTQEMVQNYFREFRGIVVHMLSTRIDRIDEGRANIRMDAALSSGAAKALRRLVPVSTDNYRFQVELVKREERWSIRYAEWRYIGIEDLFPESLSLLKKLFSDK